MFGTGATHCISKVRFLLSGPLARLVSGLGVALALCVLAGSLTGCARVKPYERGRLAKSDMRWDGDAELLGGQHHATDYREGSNGGYGGGGGGCGCN